MSWLAQDWAGKIEVSDAYERCILTAYAHRADEDGEGCFLSVRSLAAYAAVEERSITRRLTAMRRRQVIGYGDQERAAYLPPHLRPTVYDLLIPYSWFSAAQLERVQQFRLENGRPLLTPEDRPDIAPPPPKKKRADAGKPAPQRRPLAAGS